VRAERSLQGNRTFITMGKCGASRTILVSKRMKENPLDLIE